MASLENRNSIIQGPVRKDFWELLISRHPIEEDHAPSTRNPYRWRSIPALRLVIVQIVREHDAVGIFVRGERGGRSAEVEDRLRPYSLKLKKALKTDSFFFRKGSNKYFFYKEKTFASSKQSNWPEMADWLHQEADNYQEILQKIVGPRHSLPNLLS